MFFQMLFQFSFTIEKFQIHALTKILRVLVLANTSCFTTRKRKKLSKKLPNLLQRKALSEEHLD